MTILKVFLKKQGKKKSILKILMLEYTQYERHDTRLCSMSKRLLLYLLKTLAIPSHLFLSTHT